MDRISFVVVNAFFMRIADDALCKYNRPNILCFDECGDLFSDDGIQTYIGSPRGPAFERISIAVFLSEDANCDFRGDLCGRPIEGDGRSRVSAESLLGALIDTDVTIRHSPLADNVWWQHLFGRHPTARSGGWRRERYLDVSSSCSIPYRSARFSMGFAASWLIKPFIPFI